MNKQPIHLEEAISLLQEAKINCFPDTTRKIETFLASQEKELTEAMELLKGAKPNCGMLLQVKIESLISRVDGVYFNEAIFNYEKMPGDQ